MKKNAPQKRTDAPEGGEKRASAWPYAITEVFRHLSTLSVDLDQYEVEVESTHPLEGLPYGSLSRSLSRTLDIDEHPGIRRAVEALVREVKKVLFQGDPEYKPTRCDRCVHSDCCSFGRIFLTRQEAKRILDFLGKPASALSRYFEEEKDLTGSYDLIFRHAGGHCVFLKKKDGVMRCSIYPVRPRVCREFDAASCDEWSEMLPARKGGKPIKNENT